MKKQKTDIKPTIALNKKVKHDYFIDQRFEAGIALEGWEVKSLRAGRAQLTGAYVLVKNNEIWLIGTTITPLPTASTHIHPDPIRTRKLLLNKVEIKKLIGNIERKGYTLVPLALYWKRNKVKCEIALVHGKKLYDKRETIKKRDFDRQKSQILKQNNR
ncbi:MAG: SsrA-binding protein SmpB [Pseudomonadota bacterium]